MKNGVIIQARMGSTRLPGKVMRKLFDKTILEHDIERIKLSKNVDEVIIATTTEKVDDIIEKEAIKCGVKVFRGSQEDVLSRYYFAAKENNINIVVRITSDCPLIDPVILDNMLEVFSKNSYEYMSNQSEKIEERTYPRGLDTEIFRFEILERAYLNANKPYQREHVTPYIYENASKRFHYKCKENYSNYRWTLDTIEDWNFISSVYNGLYKGRHDFFMDDIICYLNKNPELQNINKMVDQKPII